MSFINAHPKEAALEEKQPEKVEFMWDDYHKEAIENAVEVEDEEWDEEWDDEDDEGVEIIYQR